MYPGRSWFSVPSLLDPTLESIEKAQQTVEEDLQRVDTLVDQLDRVLIPLPISMKPNTANLGITVKNPRPIIEIKQGVSSEVNISGVQKILDEFVTEADDFMSTNTVGNVLDYDKYKKAISLAKFSLVPSDPFPKYENLNPANISWLPFLYNNFVVTGAQSYGFPGFSPFPLG